MRLRYLICLLGDIRNSLPEWDESLLPEASWRHIMWTHSIRYMAAEAIEHLDGDYYIIMRKFNLSETKCNKIMKAFIEKLDTQNKQIVFTELEKKIADYITIDDWNNHLRYAPWNFPLAMSEEDIINAIREAYLNASKRSRRIIPDEHDYTNMDTWHIKNCECLYQGKGGDLIVRFLFNFKDMKIVAAYPVLKEKKRIGRTLNYYDKDRKCFDWMHLYDNT